VFTQGDELWSTVWAVVVDEEGNEFVSNGARIPVPEPIATLIREGGEMGPMVAQLTGKTNIKHKQGMIGIITEEYTDRKIEYQAIALLAVGQWFGRNWRQKLQK
jgi:non-canonical (house-cleaning) NTP pyrophosphatase